MPQERPGFKNQEGVPKKKITFEVDGEVRRLAWVAENRPEILIRALTSGNFPNTSALTGALKRVGYDGTRMFEEAKKHPEWGIRLTSLESLFSGVSVGGREREDVP